MFDNQSYEAEHYRLNQENRMRVQLILLCSAAISFSACSRPEQPATAALSEAVVSMKVEDPMAVAINGDWRAAENIARDVHRHPAETLALFGVQPHMTVIEITPGGGWYTEILAPYLRANGNYIGALNDPTKQANERASNYFNEQNALLRGKMAGRSDVYDRARFVEFDSNAPEFGQEGSADAVLTFRNVHNWMMNNQHEAMFGAFFKVLKPGGVLGVVEHRAANDVPDGDRSGYVSQAQVVAMAEAAGFVLEESSEINANPKDTRDHANGVWTLPPVNRTPEGEDAAKYQAIGESDRMTLRFRKPDPTKS